MSSTNVEKAWWKETVVYQIYPASFKDSDGDGLGDIPGIISKIPYISSLGVNAVWLSPIYKSPQHDMGYDISDYRDIHRPYGTLEDVQRLIDELHKNQIKLLMDLVVNHTSDEHAWFKESRSSKQSPKRDWYFWRDPRYDASGNRQEPNNWRSIFGGSAWHYDETTDQYYLALFLPSQPDLNWSNADMRQATYDDMRFWQDRGVDGFRIDSMNLMSKHPDLPDATVTRPKEKYQDGSEFFASGPKMHDYIREMRTEVFDHYDAMTVGELGFTNDERSVSEYVAKDRHELNMVFTGDIVDMDFGPGGKYERDDFHPRKIRHITNMWQCAMPKFDGWNSVYLDNHDSGRSLSRYASDKPEHRAASAKMLATYLMTLAGTPFLLAGQEFGMANLGKDYGVESYIDVEAKNAYNAILWQRGGNKSSMGDVLREMQRKARDHGRLPVQWDDSPNAGFTAADAKPWMTINKDYIEWNAASQQSDKESVLNFYRQVLQLRKDYVDLLVYGSYKPLDEKETGEMVLGYERASPDESQHVAVLLNFSDQEQSISAAGYDGYNTLISNGRSEVAGGRVRLGAYGAVVLLKD
ncbi:glycoside hydrolase family 13 protein [Zasmidium cellare ATCC 36951]|uniref:Glycoside hydrolase family 13 protein n=1 Tax=Zasmidium cellare ATCC 36951 TaxID=1080233 RepID=A0A6A6CLD7_ZASCE|nr:glycoside hydrolase family 13 protein [Zasmidium cellare ATCC 36951]KAF2167018.1 glycoside hydrolase family 13 protein [Zasmidium cellare ATCC 36951]